MAGRRVRPLPWVRLGGSAPVLVLAPASEHPARPKPFGAFSTPIPGRLFQALAELPEFLSEGVELGLQPGYL
jgi:hypothetical protein